MYRLIWKWKLLLKLKAKWRTTEKNQTPNTLTQLSAYNLLQFLFFSLKPVINLIACGPPSQNYRP